MIKKVFRKIKSIFFRNKKYIDKYISFEKISDRKYLIKYIYDTDIYDIRLCPYKDGVTFEIVERNKKE